MACSLQIRILVMVEHPIRGYSLLELLIAFTLLVFIFLSTAQLLIFAQSVFNRNRDLIQGSHYLAEELERLGGLPDLSPDLSAGEHTREQSDFPRKRNFLLRWTIQETAAGQKTVHIVCCRADYDKRKIESYLILLNRLGF